MAPQVEQARVPEPAVETEVLREQLDYLIEHATRNEACGCSECQRFARVRTALLEIFAEPPKANVHQMGTFAKAA